MEHRRNQKRENYHKNIVLEEPRKKDRERKLRNYHKSSKIGLVRFRNNIRKTIYSRIKNKKFEKKCSTLEILGCDWETLKKYFEAKFQEGMTWDNIGKWHIDHIVPLAIAKTEEEVIRLNHYTNLQPLWAKDNLMKSYKMTPLAEKKLLRPYEEI